MVSKAAYFILFLLPLGYFLWPRRGSRASLPNILLGCYVYPLILLTMVSGEGFSLPDFSISLESANVLRAVVHGALACWLIRRALKSRTRFIAAPGTILAFIAIALMFFSAFFLGSVRDAFLRIDLLLVLSLNVFVLIPTIADQDQKTYTLELARGCIFLAFYLAGLSATIFALQGNYAEWALRLGRPLNPNSLAFLLLFGFVSAVFLNRNLVAVLALLIALIATGSRLPLAFALFWLLIQCIKKSSAWRRVALVLIACCSLGFVYWVQTNEIAWDGEGIFERSDVWSGRVQLWIEAVDSIGSSPVWGRGDRFYVEGTDVDEPMRAHNMLLENSVSYGVPASLAAFLVYVILVVVAYRTWKHRNILPQVSELAPIWLFFLAFELGTTFVETSIWTNLGDGGNILFFLFVGPGLANANAALAASKKSRLLQLELLRSRS